MLLPASALSIAVIAAATPKAEARKGVFVLLVSKVMNEVTLCITTYNPLEVLTLLTRSHDPPSRGFYLVGFIRAGSYVPKHRRLASQVFPPFGYPSQAHARILSQAWESQNPKLKALPTTLVEALNHFQFGV